MDAMFGALLLVETAIGWDIVKIAVSGGIGFLLGTCKDNITQPKRKLSCKASYCPIGSLTEFRFMISHVGNTAAENVRTVDEKNNATSMSCTWSYVNPGDDIELTANIQSCTNPDQVTLEIDGKSTTIARTRLTMQC
jgi:hypothetical protein